jgi:hypothetical protein|tara:strand:+ start:216 stop:344 length:129 start_codon:yes stop_codon:yes gene_type:complete
MAHPSGRAKTGSKSKIAATSAAHKSHTKKLKRGGKVKKGKKK